MYSTIFTEQASFDVEEIYYYSELTFGIVQAEKYIEGIYQALLKLEKMPKIDHIRNDIPPQMRSLIVEQHCILYEVDEAMQKLIIIRVIHARMNFEKFF